MEKVHPANQCTYCVIRHRLRAFPQFKEERNQPANCTYFHMWLFVYTLYTHRRLGTQTMTSVVLFDFDCLHIDACSFFSLRSYYYFLISFIRFCVAMHVDRGWIAHTHCAASRTENCINNNIEKKCSRERLLHEYSYGLHGLGIVLHALMPSIKLLRL